jgi:ABC-2 type transport system permease protein
VIRRLLSVLHARNLEFLRDRGTLAWTLVLPVMLVIGMSFVFGGTPRPLFKVGVLGGPLDPAAHPFLH